MRQDLSGRIGFIPGIFFLAIALKIMQTTHRFQYEHMFWLKILLGFSHL